MCCEKNYIFLKNKSLLYSSGFPKWGRLMWGGNLGKMAKNCKKMTKSAFLGQNSGGIWRGQGNFSSSGGDPPVPAPTRGNPAP